MNQSSQSIRTVLAFGVAAAVTMAMSACVSGTPYQRAQDLQSAQASAEEIIRSLEDPSWKLRCLAARACGSRPEVPCLSKLRDLVTAGPSMEVRACALEGLAALCEHGGRAELAAIAKTELALSMDQTALPAAVLTCPSADAVLAVALTGTGAVLLDHITGSSQIPTEPLTRRDWLQRLSRHLPEPRQYVLQELQAAEAAARAKEAAANADRETADRAEADRMRQAKAVVEGAEGQIIEKDFAAASASIELATDLGADTSALRISLETARDAAASASLSRAWRLARSKRFAEAEEEYQNALKLGRNAPDLDQLIASSAWGRRRARERADALLANYLREFPKPPTDCEESWLTQRFPRFARFKKLECNVEPHSLLYRFDVTGRVNSALAYISRASEEECLDYFRSFAPPTTRSAGKRRDPSRNVYIVQYYFSGVPEDYVVGWSRVSGESTCTVTVCNPAAGPMAGTSDSNQCRPQ